MEKLFFIFIIVMLLSGCSSKEEKADKFLHEYIPKIINNPDSYEPLETNVVEAFNSPYNDTTFIKSVEKLMGWEEELSMANKRLKILTDAANVPIWGDNQNALHYEFMPNLDNHPLRQEIIDVAKLTDELGSKIDLEKQYQLILLPNSKEKVGWKIYHKFKHIDLSGNERIEDIYLVVDQNFKDIILIGDMNNPYFQDVIEYIKQNYDFNNQ